MQPDQPITVASPAQAADASEYFPAAPAAFYSPIDRTHPTVESSILKHFFLLLRYKGGKLCRFFSHQMRKCTQKASAKLEDYLPIGLCSYAVA